MFAEMISKVIEPNQAFLAPLVNTNKLVVNHLEKVLDLQMNALQFYMDIGVDRLKAAAEVDDWGSLQDFLAGQFEVAVTMAQKMMDDTKTLVELGTDFQAEFDKQVKKSELTDKTAKATQQAAGKTAKALKETTDKAAKETDEAIHKTA